MARRILIALLVVGLGSVAGYTRATLDRMAPGSSTDELLYLPDGQHLKFMSLGHETLLADMIYLWAIQYYSNYEREQRHRWVEHVFGNVITELDPRYVDAYWVGALILILEVGDVEAGVGLLEKGASRNPDNWILPYLAAWECYHAKRYDEAAAYFQRASTKPGAPTAVRRMRAGLTAKSGDQRDALAMWRSIKADPASDALSIKIATRKVRELQTRIDVRLLQNSVGRFQIDNGRWPANLEELVHRSYLGQLPLDPDESAYLYDTRTGRVSSPTGLVLGGS
jgi:tetratricopeptide (TPR) repeat protein